jgi:tetratricopeptide (TPR) repeat protein
MAANRVAAPVQPDLGAAAGTDAGAESLVSPRRLRVTLRALLSRAGAELAAGRPESALVVLEQARDIAESPGGTDEHRAEVFFRLGCCRLALGAPATAASLLTLALDFCDRAARPSDRLRTSVLDWRSRCYQRLRDWDAARGDIERALELANDLGDPHVSARVYFQASIVAEREKQWLLARFYAEQARDLLRELGDGPALGKVLNNLGGINFLLGDVDQALACLVEALRVAGNDLHAGYVLSSLAQVRLRTGDPAGAAAEARAALARLGGHRDQANEVASAELVLARALHEQGRSEEAAAAFERAEAVLEGFGSASHLSAAWLAGGDIARGSGDLERAADLYRRAAEALQDVHF